MVVPRTLEVLASADALSIAARDALAYRASVGMNWYINGHRLKAGVMHRQSFNVLGVRRLLTPSSIRTRQSPLLNRHSSIPNQHSPLHNRHSPIR
jgi:hypothetical protein